MIQINIKIKRQKCPSDDQTLNQIVIGKFSWQSSELTIDKKNVQSIATKILQRLFNVVSLKSCASSTCILI